MMVLDEQVDTARTEHDLNDSAGYSDMLTDFGFFVAAILGSALLVTVIAVTFFMEFA